VFAAAREFSTSTRRRPNGTPSKGRSHRDARLVPENLSMMCAEPHLDGPLAQLLREDSSELAPLHIAEMDPRRAPPSSALFPEEARAIERAVESRQQQFTAGRLLARHAWRGLGVAPMALLNDEQRVPRWPEGLVGSITHTHGWCAAVVARDAHFAALGSDVEAATPLDPGLWERICRPEERALLERLGDARAGLLAKAFFSAKESIYKALYPRARVFLDFQAMHIELEPGAAPGRWRWQAELQLPWGPFRPGQRFGPGRLGIDGDWIVTGIALPRGALSAG
jgi:4'-phosphopantetheinyl transferase EntD